MVKKIWDGNHFQWSLASEVLDESDEREYRERWAKLVLVYHMVVRMIQIDPRGCRCEVCCAARDILRAKHGRHIHYVLRRIRRSARIAYEDARTDAALRIAERT